MIQATRPLLQKVYEESMKNDHWQIFQGPPKRTPITALNKWLKSPPPWRRLTSPVDKIERQIPTDEIALRRGQTYVCSGYDELIRVNMALMLRRPLLVTGAPGIGKSTLAYGVAWCLGLGTPLRWEINSRTTLHDGLYTYDAVGHLHASQTRKRKSPIGEFITLGPLGTALLPTPRPRVLLIDEIDKASFDLPNDLLHVFEEGVFTIPELVRLGKKQRLYVTDSRSGGDRVTVSEGRISTIHHPIIIMTSNEERSFSEAFLRRCVCLELKQPNREHLQRVVATQLEGSVPAELVGQALDRYRDQTTDVLLQALFLQNTHGVSPDDIDPALRRSN
jgi:MoxR-like ATPase